VGTIACANTPKITRWGVAKAEAGTRREVLQKERRSSPFERGAPEDEPSVSTTRMQPSPWRLLINKGREGGKQHSPFFQTQRKNAPLKGPSSMGGVKRPKERSQVALVRLRLDRVKGGPRGRTSSWEAEDAESTRNSRQRWGEGVNP